MAVRTPSGRTLPGNLAIIPSEQSWVFHAIYQYAFPHLYSSEFVLEIAWSLLTKMKLSTDHLSLSSKLPVIFRIQKLCFVPFTVCGWLLRRIYSLCLKTVNMEKCTVGCCVIVSYIRNRIFNYTCINSYLSVYMMNYPTYRGVDIQVIHASSDCF